MKLFRINLYTVVALSMLTSCSPKTIPKASNNNYKPLDKEYSVYVLENNEEIPVNSELISDIKIGYSGFSADCSYNNVINAAKERTRNSGANILKITSVKKPNPFNNTCYGLQGKTYRNLDTSSIKTIKEIIEARNKSNLPEKANYAVIHFYRPSGSPGSLLDYNIKTDKDSIIGNVGSGSHFDYITKDFGPHSFYGVLETKASLTINIQQGEEYYVRCEVKYGVLIGRPVIKIVENSIGRKEYTRMK